MRSVCHNAVDNVLLLAIQQLSDFELMQVPQIVLVVYVNFFVA